MYGDDLSEGEAEADLEYRQLQKRIISLPRYIWALLADQRAGHHSTENEQLVRYTISQLNIPLPLAFDLREEIFQRHGPLNANLYKCAVDLEVAKARYQFQPHSRLGPDRLPLGTCLLSNVRDFPVSANFSGPLREEWSRLVPYLPEDVYECEAWADALWDLLYWAIDNELN